MFGLYKKNPDYTPQYIESPQDKKPAYTIGITEDSTCVTLHIGYTTLTMTKLGCENLIEQLQVFKNQLEDEE